MLSRILKKRQVYHHQMYWKRFVVFTVLNLSDLQWHIFQSYMKNLQPTMSSLHFFIMVLRRYYLSLQCLPSPVKYGLEFSNGLLVPITTDNVPPPLAFVKMSSCGYKKEIFSNRCNCFKNNVLCIDQSKSLHAAEWRKLCRIRWWVKN